MIIWMIFIFIMSNTNGNDSSSQSNFFANIILQFINIDKETLTFLIRKLAHMSEYAILALFTYYALIKIAFNKRIIFQITFLISFCASEGDEAAIDKILELLSMEERGEVNLMFYKGDVDNFLLEYLSLESVFTTRFHAMILSILGGQNIYPLIYSDKMENVLNDLEYCGTSLRIDKMEEALNEEKMLLDMANNRCSLDNVRQKSLEQFKVRDLYLNEETR